MPQNCVGCVQFINLWHNGVACLVAYRSFYLWSVPIVNIFGVRWWVFDDYLEGGFRKCVLCVLFAIYTKESLDWLSFFTSINYCGKFFIGLIFEKLFTNYVSKLCIILTILPNHYHKFHQRQIKVPNNFVNYNAFSTKCQSMKPQKFLPNSWHLSKSNVTQKQHKCRKLHHQH